VTTITNANITDKRRSVFVAPTGARNQGLINGKIVPTVASNNLTVAIKTLTDTDPSATNPVGIWINNELKWITAAFSVATLTAGTNYFNSGSSELATREVDYFVYVGNNAGTIFMGISRLPYGRTLADFNLVSATVDRTFWGASGTVSPVVNIGRFAATLSGGAGYTWTVPAFTNANLIQEPIYETRWLGFTATYSASGAMTWTSITTDYSTYKIQSDLVNYELFAIGTTGGSASSELRATLPIGASPAFNAQRFGGGAVDNVGIACLHFISTTLNTARFDGANYGLGASRGITTKIIYRLR
jgi:hypothetical protein